MKDKKFTNLKAHDCHMLMTQLLPVTLRDYYSWTNIPVAF
jgi:hypothetical protein